VSTAIVTGASGLVGSETVRFLHGKGMDVIGIDNNLREYFFGQDGSTRWKNAELNSSLRGYRHMDLDVRDKDGVFGLFKREANVSLVVHCAAQPSHDWAAREPITDFTVNAYATLLLLEAIRCSAPDAVFIFTSTNKVYGDTPNLLPMVELDTRWELVGSHAYASRGIDESMSVDQTKHSIFGASKIAADIMTQEYGRYFGLKTGTFRCGCLTGPAHSGAELHGFLSYLVKCVVTGRPYTIYGYKGKQVRDNIHSHDLVKAFWHFFENPRPGEVYNMGGSRHSNCSVLEAISKLEILCQRKLSYSLDEHARSGDHIWWISDVAKFRRHFPAWSLRYTLDDTLEDLVDAAERRIPGGAA
jgi:CDP-paratose 2-epimerase